MVTRVRNPTSSTIIHNTKNFIQIDYNSRALLPGFHGFFRAQGSEFKDSHENWPQGIDVVPRPLCFPLLADSFFHALPVISSIPRQG